MGYRIAAEASPKDLKFSAGKVVGSSGNDLLGAFDIIAVAKGHPTALVQVTHVGGEPPRRVKLRESEAFLDPIFHMPLLAAWSEEEYLWRLGRREDDYLWEGWALRESDRVWPWMQPKQESLPHATLRAQNPLPRDDGDTGVPP